MKWVFKLPRLEMLHCDLLPAALLPLPENAALQSISADACPGEGAQRASTRLANHIAGGAVAF